MPAMTAAPTREMAEAPEDKVEVHVVHGRVQVVLEEVHEVRRCCVTQLRMKPGNLQEDKVGPEGEDDITGPHRRREGQKQHAEVEEPDPRKKPSRTRNQ